MAEFNPLDTATNFKVDSNKTQRIGVGLVRRSIFEKSIDTYKVEFSNIDGSASGGDAFTLASGIYFYQLRAGDPSTGSGQGFIETRKMVLIK